jgi:transcriptional regulator with XRE-family HTH domain
MERPSPLRARRILRGKRLRDVAHAIGTTDSALSRLERGEARLVGPVLRELARFYATSPSRLVDEMRAWTERAAGRARDVEMAAPKPPDAAA